MIVALAVAAALSYSGQPITAPARPAPTYRFSDAAEVGAYFGSAGMYVRSCAGGAALVGRYAPRPTGNFLTPNRNFTFAPDLSEADKNVVVRFLIASIERDQAGMKPLCVEKRP